MNRREALSRVGLLMGGTIVGADIFLSGCAKPKELKVSGLDFSDDIISFLDEVGETILPTTASSPGAKEAKIGEFMKVIVTDCYEEKDQKIFLEGMSKLNEVSVSQFNDSFTHLAADKKHELLVQIDTEAKEYSTTKTPEDPVHYFTLMKQLTLWGYFTSEIGSTQALNYVPVPGRYEGCVPYKKGDKVLAAT